MSWGGKRAGRMTEKQRKHFLRTSNRALPPKGNPLGVPRQVMKQLAWEQLPFDKAAYQEKLTELMRTIEQNGG